MSKKQSKAVVKLTFDEVRGLAESLPMMRYETYKDNMEFNRVNKLLQDAIAEFNEKQAEIFTKHGAKETDGMLGFDKNTPSSVLVKVNKDISELATSESKVNKVDVEIMDEEGFDFAIRTREPIPAINSAILAKLVVKVK